MIYSDDAIRYTNVVSAPYRVHYLEQEAVLKQFMTRLSERFTLKGPLFYSLNNVPLDGIVHLEYFMPVAEERFDLWGETNWRFHSYYGIQDMLSYCLTGDPEAETLIAYRMLLDHMEQNNMDQTTPFYHVLSGDRSLPYSFVKVGARNRGNQR